MSFSSVFWVVVATMAVAVAWWGIDYAVTSREASRVQLMTTSGYVNITKVESGGVDSPKRYIICKNGKVYKAVVVDDELYVHVEK